jgi:thiosulfate/3-mercaptopyruvate sulfurtransferase
VGAYFALFAIRSFGGQKVSVYHDGFDGWREEGRPVETRETKLPPISLKLTATPSMSISTADMISRLKDANLQIVDARTVAEFKGTDVRAIRGGHIPGAVNIPYEQNWTDPETPGKLLRRQVANNRGMSLKSDGDLRKLYAGLDPNKETVVYCQSGVRAAETAAVLEKLGFRNVKVYDSSWLGYAAKLDAPVQNEVFFNVGAFRSQLSGMQARIEALERELAEARRAQQR